MGNHTSTLNKSKENFDDFYDVMDYIATHYILTMDFRSLSKLSEKEYCDKLIVLTSDVVDQYFTDTEITFLDQRIKKGVNKPIRFITKDKLADLDILQTHKKRVCIGIAKFYVKIAHMYSAILMTINPVYIYKNAHGDTIKTPLLKKHRIPKNAAHKLNICDNRMNALKKGIRHNPRNNTVTVTGFSKSKSKRKSSNLADEPGIAELMQLYLDDKYDYSNGTFNGMSAETENTFRNDLQLFYTAFTGNSVMPPTITKFSDIKLKEFNRSSKTVVHATDPLFIKYANNLTHMYQHATENQFKLLDIINDMFTYDTDPHTDKRVIRINPAITEASLDILMEKTRRFIIDLYIKCETDYATGVKIYEAIVESKIARTTQQQLEYLQHEASKIIHEIRNPLSN